MEKELVHIYLGEGKRNLPLDLYDFFGYLAPALSFFIVLFLFEYLLMKINVSDGLYIFKFVNLIFKINSNYIFLLSLVIIFVVILYVFGHLIATISCLFIDRIFINKAYGYPYKSLLFNYNNDGSNYKEKEGVQVNYYRSLFLFINLSLLLLFFYNLNIITIFNSIIIVIFFISLLMGTENVLHLMVLKWLLD